jgi:hypothetical protein
MQWPAMSVMLTMLLNSRAAALIDCQVPAQLPVEANLLTQDGDSERRDRLGVARVLHSQFLPQARILSSGFNMVAGALCLPQSRSLQWLHLRLF